MGLLVQLPNLAGVRRPAAAAVPQSFRGCRLTVSAASPGGCVKEEEAKGAGKKEKIVIRVSDPVRERRFPPPLFSAPDESSERPPDTEEGGGLGDQDGEEAKKQYYVNMGDAIRTLREELPVVFYQEPSFDIYRDDIVLKDPLNNFKDIVNYKRIFWSLRFTCQIFFKAVWIDIVSIWQPVDNVIIIRWIVHGIPRVPWEAMAALTAPQSISWIRMGRSMSIRWTILPEIHQQSSRSCLLLSSSDQLDVHLLQSQHILRYHIYL